jgi:hypothetical protein
MRHPLLLTLIAALALCLTIQPAPGQDARPRDPQPAPTADRLINVEFEGGTLLQYARMVQRAAGDSINIVLADDKVGQATIPPLALRNVDPYQAMRTVEETQFVVAGRQYMLALDEVRGSTTQSAVTVRVMAIDRGNVPGSQQRQTMIFAAQPLLDAGMEAEHLLSAVEIALNLSAKAQPADVRFHEETGLIFASGDLDQLRAIDQLMGTLRGSYEQRLSEPVENLEAELEEAHGEIEQLEMEIEELHGLLEEREAQCVAMEGEMRAMEMEREMLEQQVQQRVEQIEAEAERQIQQVREQAEQRQQMQRERAEQQMELMQQQVEVEAERQNARLEVELENVRRVAEEEIDRRERRIHELEELLAQLRAEHEER